MKRCRMLISDVVVAVHAGEVLKRDPGRQVQRDVGVGLAAAEHRRVHGHHDGAVAGRLRSLYKRPRQPAIELGVELEPADRIRRDRAAAATCSMLQVATVLSVMIVPACGSRARGGRLAIGVAHPLESGRRDDQRHRVGVPSAVVSIDAALTSTSIRGRRRQRRNAATLSRSVTSSSAPLR